MLLFIGRFHPLLVHLPVGILLLAACFQWASHKEKYHSLKTAARIALFWGMLTAVASCITGYLLSLEGEYEEALVDKHQWLGISVALVAAVAYYLHKKNNQWLNGVVALMCLLVVITGHLGGTLTHGEGYLTQAFLPENNTKETTKIKPIANVQEAVAYTDIVQPILESKCYGCHGRNKQKGKLRMDDINAFAKGGKHGEVFVPGKADESELMKRLALPRHEEGHMPPKEKPQPTPQQMELLQWWINCGASFDKKVNQLHQPEKIKPLLLALQNPGASQAVQNNWLPEKEVVKADEVVVGKIRAVGVAVVPVSRNRNYLSVSFIAAGEIKEETWKLLVALKEQLVELRMGAGNLSKTGLTQLALCTGLRKLYLNNTSVTDNDLAGLKTLTQLQYLNLVNTKVTAQGLLSLAGLKELSVIYLYKTGVAKADWASLQQAFPKMRLDSGGYTVETLPGDTSELKKPIEKK
jgi:uncharacterized membrane protein